MKVAIIGSGNIGSNVGLRAADCGHEVIFSYARSEEKLANLALQAGSRASIAAVGEAVKRSDAIVFAVPWGNRLDVFPSDLSFDGKVVIDATNQFSRAGIVNFEGSAVSQNFSIFPGAYLAKAFNTLTAGFQMKERDRQSGDRHAMFFAGEEKTALEACELLISVVGFVPVHLGGWDVVELLEAPRRNGSVYGEAYRPDDARRIAETAQTNIAASSALAHELKHSE